MMPGEVEGDVLALAIGVVGGFLNDLRSGATGAFAMSARIVDAHHGEISVRSTMGGGTTFTVTLPSS